MKKKTINQLMTLLVIGLVGVGVYMLFGETIKGWFLEKPVIQANLYDANGNSIGTAYSVVGGTQGVYYINFDVTANNDAQATTYDFTIVDASPPELLAALDQAVIAGVVPGQSGQWSSALIETTTFEGQSQPVDFSVTIRGDFVCPSGYTCDSDAGQISAGQSGSQTKTATMTLTIEPDPIAEGSFSVGIGSSVGDGFGETTTMPSGGTCQNTLIYGPTSAKTTGSFQCSPGTTGMTWDYCELWIETDADGNPITPQLMDTCDFGYYCTYQSAEYQRYTGYGVIC